MLSLVNYSSKLPLRIGIKKVLARTPKTPDFVLPGLPVGSVAALVGPGGVGKSFFLQQLASELAIGSNTLSSLLCGRVKVTTKKPGPQRVVFVMAEEPADIVEARTRAVVEHQLEQCCGTKDSEGRAAMTDLLEENLHLYPLAGQGQVLVDRLVSTATEY